ncbi:hypothetical protein BC332_13723 [Capsicum chinense]|nr:hypothetical protein BC332_13723 [Capsicum chinense]
MRPNTSYRVLQLADEKHDLDTLTKELERRATTLEVALKRAHFNYSIAADNMQKYADVVHKLQEYDNTEQLWFRDQYVIAKKQTLSVDVLINDLKRSLCLQEDLYIKTVFKANMNVAMIKRDRVEIAQQLETLNLNKEQNMNQSLKVELINLSKANCLLTEKFME